MRLCQPGKSFNLLIFRSARPLLQGSGMALRTIPIFYRNVLTSATYYFSAMAGLAPRMTELASTCHSVAWPECPRRVEPAVAAAIILPPLWVDSGGSGRAPHGARVAVSKLPRNWLPACEYQGGTLTHLSRHAPPSDRRIVRCFASHPIVASGSASVEARYGLISSNGVPSRQSR